MIDVRWETANPLLLVGWVEARGVRRGAASPAFEVRLEAAVAQGAAAPVDEDLRKAVRDALRWGGYKPAGRGKPASEYLRRAAGTGFPRIDAVVDAVNLFSLESGLPISLLDVDRALEGTTGLAVREGRDGEAYVFNASGQVMDVKGLIGVARQGGALIANPVKDSMASKTGPDTTNVAAVLYAPRAHFEGAALAEVAERLAATLEADGGARGVEVRVLP